MSKVGDSTLRRLEGGNHDHEDNNAHQVFRFDRERKRKQKDFSVTVKHSERDQQAVYPPRSADRRNRRRDSGKSRISHRHGDQRGPDNTEEIEFKKLARTPILLFLRTEHPQRQHIEKQVAQASMQERIGDQLPYESIVHREKRHQAKIDFEVARKLRSYRSQDYLEEINCSANDDQPFDPPSERRKAQRHCASAIHSVATVGVSCQQGKTSKAAEDDSFHLIRLCATSFAAVDPQP